MPEYDGGGPRPRISQTAWHDLGYRPVLSTGILEGKPLEDGELLWLVNDTGPDATPIQVKVLARPLVQLVLLGKNNQERVYFRLESGVLARRTR